MLTSSATGEDPRLGPARCHTHEYLRRDTCALSVAREAS